ncbi:WbuC family cupin fold metalloprotein [Roseobacter sp.]|uniref:WbuC family cupin fold metalloprotein n=1 Tax=Roseobacter sp. TaxID=1907202 RepID=UPI00329A46DB
MSKAGFRQVAPEVFYSDGGFRAVGPEDIAFLKMIAGASPRKRARLCLHSGPDDLQQEMVIVMHREAYVQPHRHHTRVETFSLIEGRCVAILFEDTGAVQTQAQLSAPGGDGAFFYRMPNNRYHTLLFQSEWTVFVETTTGPFDPSTSNAADWAPDESDLPDGHRFMRALFPDDVGATT